MRFSLRPFLAVFLGIGLVILFTGRAVASLAISEVLWSGSDLSTTDEWLEIACTGSGSDPFCHLDGWTLTSVNTSGNEVELYRFGTGTVIASGSYAVIGRLHADASRLAQEPAFVVPGLSLPNTKLLLRLRDGAGSVQDAVDDGIGDPFAGLNGKAPDPKASMVRLDLAVSGASKDNWHTANTASGLDADALMLATPGSGELRASSSVSSSPSPERSLSVSQETLSGTILQLKISISPLESQEQRSQELIIQSETGEILGRSVSAISDTDSLVSVSWRSLLKITLLTYENGIQIHESFIQYQPVLKPNETSTEIDQYQSLSGVLLFHELLADPIGSDDAQWIELRNAGPGNLLLHTLTIRDEKTAIRYPLIPAGGSLDIPAGSLSLFYRTATRIPLSHAGGALSLLDEFEHVIDRLSYPALPESVAFGRLRDGQLAPLCVPSPGQWNEVLPSDLRLSIQTGTLSAVGAHSVNFQVLPITGSLAGVRCSVDFGDGTRVETCNPASHRFEEEGATIVQMEAINYCGTTMLQSVEVLVLPTQGSTSTTTTAEDEELSSPALSVSVIRPDTLSHLVLTKLLPNPSGKDTADREWIEFRNAGTEVGTTQGWKVRIATRDYPLPDERLAPSETLRWFGTDSHITLRNSSGSIALVNPSGVIVGSLLWDEVQPDQEVLPSPFSGSRARVYVREVIDGDTFDVVPIGQMTSESIRIRLAGIDTPELSDKNPVTRRMAEEAKNFIRTLIEGKEVELKFDTTQGRDAYNRIVATAILPTGSLLQEEIVRAGLGWVYSQYKIPETASLLALQKTAEENRVGIWVHPFLRDKIKEQENDTDELAEGRAEDLFEVLKNYAKTVRISEVFAHPGSGEEEWIEILNTGTGAVDLLHWSIDDVDGGGGKPWRVDRELVLAPGAMTLLPKSVTKLAMNDSGDAVRLLSPDGTEVDVVLLPPVKIGQAYAWSGEEIDDPEEAYCLTTEPTPGAPNRCVAPAVKVTKTAVTKAKTTTRKSTAAAKKSKESDVVQQQLIASLFTDARTGGVVESLAAPVDALPTGLSLSQVFVVVLAAMLAGAMSGVAASKGMTVFARG